MQRTSWHFLLAALPAALLTACASAPAPATAPGAIDNSALQRSDFRAHQTTYGLVYRLPADATAIIDSQVTPVVQEQLLRLKLVAEANTFNLPHVTVVHIHSADPATPRRMLAALPALPPVLQDVHLKNFYTTEAAKGAGKPWWLDLGIVKSGPAYEAMMDFNTRATAAMAPLRDGPLPRVTGPVYARMSDSAKAMVQSVGVSGINQVQSGKEVRSHNPHNTLVYSESAFTPEIERAMGETAARLNRILPGGFTTTFDQLSIVELGFAGNVTREIYRIHLKDQTVYDVRNGTVVRR
ncbi:Uncharacterised protein [Delftia tsuruhatensis]|uniref:hypothetical protein n=1 Tax=Delftia tsuruhatensis TaxID=180282 RepID=UPI001E770651|nr:hypothetical protein [Delftia tsuruhatensis]CAB5718004.1 Uncharacterised protein [Delftia tsuruhatensis]CAC9692331.1 Uncharacterised protein [Delftia tsuruhatensis]